MLWIDNSLVVDNDGHHGSKEVCADYDVSTPSVKYVEVDYFEHGGFSLIVLIWKKPSFAHYEYTPFLSADEFDALKAPSSVPSSAPSSEPSISNAPTEYVSTTHSLLFLTRISQYD